MSKKKTVVPDTQYYRLKRFIELYEKISNLEESQREYDEYNDLVLKVFFDIAQNLADAGVLHRGLQICADALKEKEVES